MPSSCSLSLGFQSACYGCFGISSSVHEYRRSAFTKLIEIARAEIAMYKDVALEDVPEEIKQLQRFIEVLGSKYHIPGENSGWKKTEK